MKRLWALLVMVFWPSVVWAQDVPSEWDPNRDTAFMKEYVRREITVDLDRVDARRGIEGTIRNDGSKTLTRVSLLLTFLDQASKPSGEYEFSALPWAGPVAPGEPEEKPLGPGISRRFLIYPSSVPAGWSERWHVSVASVRFAPEPSA